MVKLNWRWMLVLAALGLLNGCATQVSLLGMAADGGADATPAERTLRFQSNSIATTANLGFEALQPGDILLTSEPSLVSAGIRLMTFAPVSHAAVYVGEGKIVDAMRQGVRVRELPELLAEAAAVLVLRYPELTAEQAAVISEYAVNKSGAPFNFMGITLQIPFSLARRLCELPLVSPVLRDACIRGMGVMPQLAAAESRVFCSQLVLLAYRHAGVAVTGADPRLISPADILHMREGDVSSVNIEKQLRYVGRLKDQRAMASVASLD